MSPFARRMMRGVHGATGGGGDDGGTVKKNYGGLFTSSETNRTSWTPDLDHYWLKINWADIEPAQGNYDFSAIDSYLSAHPGVNVRLHVQGGDNAPVGTQASPGWLANISGGGVMVTNSRSGATNFCGLYWKQAYKDAYAAMVAAMGAKYDSNPNIASINNAGCSLIFDEPWIMGGDSGSITDLYNAGLTQATAQSAIFDALAALMAAFPTTVVEMPAHGEWTYPTASGLGSSWPDGRTQLNTLSSMYGDHIIITDYGLGGGEYEDAQPTATASSLYSWMHGRANEGLPIAFQATLTSAGGSPTTADAVAACDDAVAMGARWFEHSGWGLLSNDQVQSYDTELKANVV